MQLFRGGEWFVLMTIGSMALPPQSKIDVPSIGKEKLAIPMLEHDNEFDASSVEETSNPNSSSNNIDIDINDNSDYNNGSNSSNNNNSIGNSNNNSDNRSNTVSKPVSLGTFASITNDSTTVSSSFATPISTNPSSLIVSEIVETLPTSSSLITGMKSETSTGTNHDAMLRKTSSTTTATINNTSNRNSSVVLTETSSRTIASTQGASTFLVTSKKSTTSLNEFTTTPTSISPKETRESPGKIRPQIKLTTNYSSLSETGVRLPEGASAALAKPTKYHYYPHNQHIYLLPECAVQQVCNAVYVRLNFTQPLCACPGRYRDPCSASLDSDDLHTTELVTDPRTKALTLVKTCEPVAEMRECRTPRDWSLLALQNVRTGKSHYLVICRCPDANILEGPMSHDQPTYASVPGIRVYGMMCVQGNRRGRPLRHTRSLIDRTKGRIGEDKKTNERLSFPWYKIQQLMNTIAWDSNHN